MADLSITNVVNVSVATPPVGIADYQLNNLLILTKETQVDSSDTFTYRAYASPLDVATDWGTSSEVYQQAVLVFSQSLSIQTGNGQLIIAPQGSSETLTDAITRLATQVFFGGVLWAGYAPGSGEVVAAAETVQSLSRLLFVSTNSTSNLTAGQLCALIKGAGLTNARMFARFGGTAQQARIDIAAYASALMCVNFNGSNTTRTMHMKDLTGLVADTGITQTIANTCETTGVDYYASIAGVPKCFSTGGNGYSDDVYNLIWLRFALEVAGFNAIATSSTKLPQTDAGIAILRDAYIKVLQQAVAVGFLAPGTWTSSVRFGDTALMLQSVQDNGWYIYNKPVAQQTQNERESRTAPLMQIAVKYAGAVHSSDVIVYVNK